MLEQESDKVRAGSQPSANQGPVAGGRGGSNPLSSRFLSPGLLELLGALKAGLRAAAESQGAPHSSGLAATLRSPLGSSP